MNDGRGSVRFDLLRLRRDGKTLVDAAWDASNSPAVKDKLQDRAFTLAPRDVDIVPATDLSSFKDYDAFLAVGMAGVNVDSNTAELRAINRGFHLGHFVINEIRGDRPRTDCAHPAIVYAISIGEYGAGGNVAGCSAY